MLGWVFQWALCHTLAPLLLTLYHLSTLGWPIWFCVRHNRLSVCGTSPELADHPCSLEGSLKVMWYRCTVAVLGLASVRWQLCPHVRVPVWIPAGDCFPPLRHVWHMGQATQDYSNSGIARNSCHPVCNALLGILDKRRRHIQRLWVLELCSFHRWLLWTLQLGTETPTKIMRLFVPGLKVGNLGRVTSITDVINANKKL